MTTKDLTFYFGNPSYYDTLNQVMIAKKIFKSLCKKYLDNDSKMYYRKKSNNRYYMVWFATSNKDILEELNCRNLI